MEQSVVAQKLPDDASVAGTFTVAGEASKEGTLAAACPPKSADEATAQAVLMDHDGLQYLFWKEYWQFQLLKQQDDQHQQPEDTRTDPESSMKHEPGHPWGSHSRGQGSGPRWGGTKEPTKDSGIQNI